MYIVDYFVYRITRIVQDDEYYSLANVYREYLQQIIQQLDNLPAEGRVFLLAEQRLPFNFSHIDQHINTLQAQHPEVHIRRYPDHRQVEDLCIIVYPSNIPGEDDFLYSIGMADKHGTYTIQCTLPMYMAHYEILHKDWWVDSQYFNGHHVLLSLRRKGQSTVNRCHII